MPQPRPGRGRLLLTFVAGLGAGVVLAGGGRSALALPADPYLPLHALTEVLGWVQTRYVDTIDSRDLLYDAIAGMVAHLDEHSRFLSPDQFKELREDTEGRYFGVGISIRTEGNEVFVLRPIPGSPAERAGIQAGDRILAVDGVLASGPTQAQAIESIKGPRGTQVSLRLARDAWPEPRDFPLVRAQIHAPSVESAGLPGGTGWVRITHFQEKTGDEVRRALQQLDKAKSLSGLILDLRDDPGGLVDEAVEVADEFLDEGIIVTTRGRSVPEDVTRATRAGTRSKLPVVVLVDGDSASASEIVAGALQDHRRAPVMGTTSFGKGSVQTVFELDDGSALKLTIARYYTPSGRSIHGVGIAPDYWVEAGLPPDTSAPSPLLVRDGQVREAWRFLANPAGYQPPPRSNPDPVDAGAGSSPAAGPAPRPAR